MSPVRILHLRSGTHLFGPERIILSLARYASSGFQHFIAGAERGKPGLLLEEAKASGLATFWLNPKSRVDLQAARRLAEFLRNEKIDIIHAHDFRADFYALAARRHAPVKIMTTLHLWNHNTVLTAAYEMLDALQIRFFDRVLAVSPAIAADARRWRIPEKKLRVILNGVDTERFKPVSPRMTEERIVVGSVGRLVAQKGYDNFLKMASIIMGKMTNVDFLLVGDGPVRSELEQQAKQLALGNRVTFAGQRDPIESSYGEIDLFVSSSLSEGLPIAVLEAMASQLPVVATKVGATPEVIQHGYTGLLVDPGDAGALSDAVLNLLSNPQSARAMAEAGHKRVIEKFSAHAMVRNTEAVYQELMNAEK